jgi:septin family protein
MDQDDEDPMDINDDLTLPMSVLSPDYYAEASSQNKTDVQAVGRSYPWGFADALNPNHCDYVKLRELIFVDWRRELRGPISLQLKQYLLVDYSRQVLYEHWRSNLMRSLTH